MRICVAKLGLQADKNRKNTYLRSESAIKANNLGNRPPKTHRFDEAKRGALQTPQIKIATQSCIKSKQIFTSSRVWLDLTKNRFHDPTYPFILLFRLKQLTITQNVNQATEWHDTIFWQGISITQT